jgi:hypothetical protein
VNRDGNIRNVQNNLSDECQKVGNEIVRKVGDDIEELKYNMAISQTMICLNSIQKQVDSTMPPQGLSYKF